MNLFTLMADTCHDTRSANRFFKEHGFGQFRIQAIKRTPLENRRTYGLFIRMADYNYHRLYQSTEFRDIIQAFEFYHCGGKEDDTMMLRDLPLTVAFIAADKKDGEKISFRLFPPGTISNTRPSLFPLLLVIIHEPMPRFLILTRIVKSLMYYRKSWLRET